MIGIGGLGRRLLHRLLRLIGIGRLRGRLIAGGSSPARTGSRTAAGSEDHPVAWTPGCHVQWIGRLRVRIVGVGGLPRIALLCRSLG